jgi:hypothetical protein
MRWVSLVCFAAVFLPACGSDSNNAGGACENGTCGACQDCYQLCMCHTGDAAGCAIACNGTSSGGYGAGGTGAVSGSGGTPSGGTGGTVIPTGGLATAITITEVSIYQGVKVPLMQNGGDVPPNYAPPVVDREGRIRVFVSPTPEFQARDIVAHFEFGGSAPFSQDVQAFISGPSADNQMESTFNIDLQLNQLKGDTVYSVTLKETSTQTFPGAVAGAQWPPSGMSPIGAQTTNGPLNLTIVPMVVNGIAPDMSETRINQYRERFHKLYPAAEINLQIRQQVSYSGGVSGSGSGWNSILDYLLNVRASDNPPDNTYYYGSFTPTSSFQQFCAGACVAGLGVQPGPNDEDSRGAVGLGFFPSQGNPGATDTACHEIGHTMGRGHAPCGTDGTDPYPYSGGGIGSWGFDLVTKNLINPAQYTDMMGYCDQTWISDYNYGAIFDRLQYANSSAYMIIDDPERTPGEYQTLIVDYDGSLVLGTVRDLKRPPMSPKRTATLVDSAGKETKVTGFWQGVDHLPGGFLLVKKHQVPSDIVTLKGSLGTHMRK